MNKLDLDYQALLQDILSNGVQKQDRTGTGTISVFGRQIRHKMSDGFPLLTTKKMHWKSIVTELLWFLNGRTDLRYLLENNCHIWDGDCHKSYINSLLSLEKQGNHREMNKWMRDNGDETLSLLTKESFIEKIKTDDEFAEKWGSLGKIYGHQWRNWKGKPTTKKEYYGPEIWNVEIENNIDQIQTAIETLRNNPDDRGIIVSAWNVGELDEMTLRPCHNFFQFYTRELSLKEQAEAYNSMLEKQNYNPKWQSKIKDIDKLSEGELITILQSIPGPTRSISLMYNARSQDVALGTPFNIASYALLLEIIGRMVNMIPDELITNMGDCHIYLNQFDGVKEQLNRIPMKLPNLIISDKLNFNGTIDDFLNSYTKDSFTLNGYESHPAIKIPLSN